MKAKNEVGNRYGKLAVVERAGSKSGAAAWRCRCDCGNEAIVTGGHLRSGNTTSCGCARQQSVTEEVGNKHNLLTVIERAGTSGDGKATWKCRCECGRLTVVRGNDLRFGKVKSCGDCLEGKGYI